MPGVYVRCILGVWCGKTGGRKTRMVVGGWGGLDFDRLSLSLSVSVSPFDRPHGCENLAGECHQEQQVQGSIFFFWKSARVG